MLDRKRAKKHKSYKREKKDQTTAAQTKPRISYKYIK